MGIVDFIRRVTTARGERTELEKRIAACQAVAEDAMQVRARVLEAYNAAQERVTEAKTALARARDNYKTDHSSSNAKAIKNAREALELIELEAESDEQRLNEANLAVASAEQSLASSRAELERLTRDEVVARLMRQATAEGFREATELDFQVLVESYHAMREACARIDKAFAESIAASNELVQMGEESPGPICHYHLVGPIALHVAENDPDKAHHINPERDQILNCCYRGRLLEILRIEPLDAFFNARREPGHPEALPRLRELLSQTTAAQFAQCGRKHREADMERDSSGRLGSESLAQSVVNHVTNHNHVAPEVRIFDKFAENGVRE
ncbi:MAG: hypothetical protein QM784_00560 [Polyangiaceae bacterium]